MKHFLLILCSLFIMTACNQEKNEFQTQKQALEKPGRGHGGNVINTTLPTLTLTGIVSPGSIQWNWNLPPLAIGEIYKVIQVTRRFVDETGTVYVDPGKNVNDTLNHWQIINQGSNYIFNTTGLSSWTETDTRPLDWATLRKGTYTVYVGVTKGQYWNSLDYQDAISNRFTVTVP